VKNIIYKLLAQRLDQLPNGYPETPSGVELRLLEKIFQPEEAALAAVMRLELEPAGSIAARMNQDPKRAKAVLKNMVRKGLIRFSRDQGQLCFGLMPFVVGFYEEQLPRMDAEMAALFEEYFQETRGGITLGPVSVHRVIPVEESIDFEMEIFPYERASELIEGAKAWAVRDCICRVQQQLIGKDCGHPVENCLVLAPVEGAFDHSEVDRALSKQEALHILREAEASGLVHTTGNYIGPHYYICNCCTCSCGILRSVAEFNIPTAVAKANFLAVVDREECLGCEDCLPACQFGALSMLEDLCTVSGEKCVGCGLCAPACPTGALQLIRRPPGQVDPPPETIKEWGQRRAAARGVPFDENH
jgi:Fe-S-cluster-containing hydrogenase component 2